MKSNDLISQLSSATGWDNQKICTMLNGLTDAIKEYCIDVDSVAIPGFGTFVTEKTDEHLAVSPTDNAQMIYPPEISVKFKSSVVLRKKFIG